MKDVSLDKPVQFAFSAKLDGNHMELKGKVGPLGKKPDQGNIPLDLTFKTLKTLVIGIKGNIVDLSTRQEFDLAIKVSPCSPRKIVSALGGEFPIKTADSEVLKRVALQARVKGNPKHVSVLDGVFELDDSKVTFSVSVKDFSKPDVAFDVNLDQIDLDRYLPSRDKKKPAEKRKKSSPQAPEKRKTDYAPLRKLILDGKIHMGALKVHGVKIQDLYLKISSKRGLFRLDPLTLKLYQGNVSSKGAFDVRKNTPKTNIAVQAKGIQVNPLLNPGGRRGGNDQENTERQGRLPLQRRSHQRD
ncbi:MAG: AsmA family protein [Deltaproteobacteria bacterium]|nr:AsmA family protein [Deltaproteobacteria bacterium]